MLVVYIKLAHLKTLYNLTFENKFKIQLVCLESSFLFINWFKPINMTENNVNLEEWIQLIQKKAN